MPALPSSALALPRLALPERGDCELVQCAGARVSDVFVGDVYGVAAGEGAWAVYECGVVC